jgi:sugar transferase (PEP-CTERM system associated)
VSQRDVAATNYQVRKRFVPSSRWSLFSLDLLFMAGAMAGLIFMVRDRLGFVTTGEAVTVVLSMIVGSMAFAYAAGCYRNDALVNFSVAVTRLVVGLGVSALFLIPLIHYGWGMEFHSLAFRSVSRTVTVVLLGVGAGMSGGMLSRVVFLAMSRRHWFRRSILVIGSGTRARHLRALFDRDSHHRLAELHFLTEEYLGGEPMPETAPGDAINSLSDVYAVEELEHRLHIDQVVVAVDESRNLFFDHLLPWKANGIPVFDFNTFLERETGRVDLTWTESDWLLYSEGFHFGWLDGAVKRLMDIVISAGMLLIALPTMAIVSAAIKLEDFGPVFYRQERVSRGGRVFRILKFRTMRMDAEKFGAQWATEDDPRITRVGRFLRKNRIDEVPQLLNVLLGEMSLVGPRPERPCFVEELSENIRLYHLRHSVKAGVTGWAQINCPYGASEEDALRKLEYDLYYLKHFSVLRDLSIMLQTFRVLVFAHGGR